MRAVRSPLVVSAVVAGVLASVIAAFTPASSAATCGGTTPFAQLSGVAATSVANAWAVGSFHPSGAPVQTLILHWNGTAWCTEASPNPGGPSEPSELASVAATSASSAWAVGFSTTAAGAEQTLILRWNGTIWRQVPSPSPGPFFNRLAGVAATSASNA